MSDEQPERLPAEITPPVKRFIVFAWAEFEASGGWNDVEGWFDTFDEAIAYVRSNLAWLGEWKGDGFRKEWVAIVDQTVGRQVWQRFETKERRLVVEFPEKWSGWQESSQT